MTRIALHDWHRTGATVLIQCPFCEQQNAEPLRAVEADGHLDHTLCCCGCRREVEIELLGWIPPRPPEAA